MQMTSTLYLTGFDYFWNLTQNAKVRMDRMHLGQRLTLNDNMPDHKSVFNNLVTKVLNYPLTLFFTWSLLTIISILF